MVEKQFLYLIATLLVCQASIAASIEGAVYTPELSAAKYSLLSINTAPAQRILLEDGTYNITVPRGTYTIEVTYYRDNKKYEDRLNVTVVDDGKYTYDFIVFSTETNQTKILVTPEDLSFNTTAQVKSSTMNIGGWPAAILLIALVVLAAYFSRRQWWNTNNTTTEPVAPASEEKTEMLPEDLAGVLAAIKSEGGRTTQKELRKHIPVSEAKLSMMLTELEAKGKVKKIKKGRGNLIVLR